MHEFKVYLAWAKSKGQDNKVAAKALVSAFNDSLTTFEKHNLTGKFELSLSKTSRIKHGDPTLEDQANVKRALEQLFKTSGELTAEMTLSNVIEQLKASPDVVRVLDSEVKESQSNKNLKVLDPETRDVLGLWMQVNYSCVESGNVDRPTIRTSLRLIYNSQNVLRSRSIGITTDWQGDAVLKRYSLYLNDQVYNQQFAESASFIFRRFPSLLYDNTKLIPGMMLIMGLNEKLNDPVHLIFSGRIVLIKPAFLEKEPQNPTDFFGNAKALKSKYCKHYPLDGNNIPKIPMLEKYSDALEAILCPEGKRSINIMHV